MTAEECARRLVLEESITKTVGTKHEDPASAAYLIAAEIRAAVLAEREACARLVEERTSFLSCSPDGHGIADAIRRRPAP